MFRRSAEFKALNPAGWGSRHSLQSAIFSVLKAHIPGTIGGTPLGAYCGGRPCHRAPRALDLGGASRALFKRSLLYLYVFLLIKGRKRKRRLSARARRLAEKARRTAKRVRRVTLSKRQAKSQRIKKALKREAAKLLAKHRRDARARQILQSRRRRLRKARIRDTNRIRRNRGQRSKKGRDQLKANKEYEKREVRRDAADFADFYKAAHVRRKFEKYERRRRLKARSRRRLKKKAKRSRRLTIRRRKCTKRVALRHLIFKKLGMGSRAKGKVSRLRFRRFFRSLFRPLRSATSHVVLNLGKKRHWFRRPRLSFRVNPSLYEFLFLTGKRWGKKLRYNKLFTLNKLKSIVRRHFFLSRRAFFQSRASIRQAYMGASFGNLKRRFRWKKPPIRRHHNRYARLFFKRRLTPTRFYSEKLVQMARRSKVKSTFERRFVLKRVLSLFFKLRLSKLRALHKASAKKGFFFFIRELELCLEPILVSLGFVKTLASSRRMVIGGRVCINFNPCILKSRLLAPGDTITLSARRPAMGAFTKSYRNRMRVWKKLLKLSLLYSSIKPNRLWYKFLWHRSSKLIFFILGNSLAKNIWLFYKQRRSFIKMDAKLVDFFLRNYFF